MKNMLSTSPTDLRIPIHLEIELGSVRARCKHHGICSFMEVTPGEWTVFVPTRLRRVKALLLPDGSEALLLFFPFEGMLPATRKRFFPPEGFRMDAPTPLPAWLIERSGFGKRSVMLPGNYGITVVDSGYNIHLLMTRQHEQILPSGTHAAANPEC